VSTTEGVPLQATATTRTGDAVSAESPIRDVVSVRLPANAAYLAVLRTTTASLAAQLDFTLDEIEDLRIAVDETCCLLLAGALPNSELTCTFEMTDDAIRISVSGATERALAPARDSFAWTVLTALAGDVDAWTEPDGRQTIALAKQRSWGAIA
jgi:serine/threonine-protein kinase RsbW